VPIPEGKYGAVSDSTQFRGITLSSIYGKIFDNIILFRYGDRLSSAELQFGFKAKSSTNLCSVWYLKNHYYIMHIINLLFSVHF
jgi:hypothetical protein